MPIPKHFPALVVNKITTSESEVVSSKPKFDCSIKPIELSDLDAGKVLVRVAYSALNYKDAMNYRLGFKYVASPTSEWRFGMVRDFTPQPSSSVGPLLPDATRNGLTAGYGRTGGKKFTWDLALMYLPFKKRTTLDNQDGYNGTYDTTAFLLGATVGW